MTPLRKRMTEHMRLKGCSPRTIKSYVNMVAVYARHVGKIPRPKRAKTLPAQLELAPVLHYQAPQTGLIVTEPQTVWFCCPVCGSNDRVKIEVLPPKVFRANMLRQTDRGPPETSVLISIC